MTSFPFCRSRAFNYWLYGTGSIFILALIVMGGTTFSYLKVIRKNKKALVHCYYQQQEIAQAKQHLAELNENKMNSSPKLNTSIAAILANINYITELLGESTRLKTFQMSDNTIHIIGQSNSVEQALVFYNKLSKSHHFDTLHFVSMRPHEELTEFVINGNV